jgi:hypothetical protein
MIPYSDSESSQVPDAGALVRLEHYRKFCDLSGRVLDIGQPSFVSRSLGITHNTAAGMNFNAPDEWHMPEWYDYDTITCFEVLEHLMNPLRFIEEMRPFNGKRMYLSTPLCPPLTSWMWKGHFTEYRLEALLTLFEYVGLEVVRYEIFRTLPFKHALTGIRPFIRWAFAYKTILFELR